MTKEKSKPFNLELWKLREKPYVHTKAGHKVVEITEFKDVAPNSFVIAGIVSHPQGRVLMTWRADGRIGAPQDGDMFSEMDLMMRAE